MHTVLRYTTIIMIIFSLFSFTVSANDEARKLNVPNGQLLSKLFVVNVIEETVKATDEPCLRLLSTDESDHAPRSHSQACQKGSRQNSFFPIEVSYNVTIETPNGSHQGSRLIFNLSDLESVSLLAPRKTFTPVLYWKDSDNNLDSVISSDPIYIGVLSKGMIWAIFIVGVTLLSLRWLAKAVPYTRSRLLSYMANTNGQLMLPLLQMGIWTIAIGTVVLCFALIGLGHDIPESLVMLMGFSAVTGVAGHWQAKKIMDKEKLEDEKKHDNTGEIVDGEKKDNDAEKNSSESHPIFTLVCVRSTIDNPAEGQSPVVYTPSLAKAQMLFWTLLTVSIFCYKSIIEGTLWEVPNELVLLMGISQAGYLGREQLEVGKGST